MKNFLDFCLEHKLNSDDKSSHESFKSQKLRKSSLEEFRFCIANWTKNGNIRTSFPKVKAKDMESAVRKIEKRFPKAYDISMGL
jgi:hypothetical protein